MSDLAGLDRGLLADTLDELGADGWLLYDFHGVNPVTPRMLGPLGMGTRRLFVYLPKQGEPVAVVHRIELQPFRDFPGRVVPYARWEELHEALRSVVGGRTVAMEVSPEDAVPYLDRVPYGVVELLTRLGARVVPSSSLVTRFAAAWTPTELEDHLFAAEVLARVARRALQDAVRQAGSGLREVELQRRVIADMREGGLELDTLPIVGFGANSANPHYEPLEGQDAELQPGDVVLLDLWGGRTRRTVFADQTWMGFAGETPPEEVATVWETVRRARDAAVALARSAASADRPVRGFELDRAARDIIERAGYGEAFVHRTGHSIDRDLHGSGPHIDSYETRDERVLLPGVGFSVEPGVYLEGRFGVRSEINVYMAPGGPRVTPEAPQQDLITV